MKINWRTVLRDAVGVLLLGSLGGLVGRAIGGDWGRVVSALSAMALMTAAFCVSGCLAKQARFKHVALVAVGVLVISTILAAIKAGGSFALSLSDIVLIVTSMLLGGLISLVIVRPPAAAPPPGKPPPAAPPPA